MNKKFLDAYEVPNIARFIFTSNSEWVVPVGLGDRRFTVLRVNDKYCGDYKYFDALFEQLAANDNAGYRGGLHLPTRHIDETSSAARTRPRAFNAEAAIMLASRTMARSTSSLAGSCRPRTRMTRASGPGLPAQTLRALPLVLRPAAEELPEERGRLWRVAEERELARSEPVD